MARMSIGYLINCTSRDCINIYDVEVGLDLGKDGVRAVARAWTTDEGPIDERFDWSKAAHFAATDVKELTVSCPSCHVLADAHLAVVFTDEVVSTVVVDEIIVGFKSSRTDPGQYVWPRLLERPANIQDRPEGRVIHLRLIET